MRTRCLDFRDWAFTEGRCRLHHTDKKAQRNAKSAASRRQRLASGDGAQARWRKRLNKAGAGLCNGCGREFLSADLAIDHVVPLFRNGHDVESNVQLLCHDVCHKAKTARQRREG
ncbi:HNH endonuclease [Streptomyces olivaceus]|uniref:HNH endonuclease n=1 Tax=Streptomyces olivaceus TaxID=47716 RepID=UPI0036490F5B